MAATMSTGLLAAWTCFAYRRAEFADLFGEAKDQPAGESRSCSAEALASGVAGYGVDAGFQGFHCCRLARRVPAGMLPRGTVDTTCAGARLWVRLLRSRVSGAARGHDIKKALDVAAKAAALATTKVGAQQSNSNVSAGS